MRILSILVAILAMSFSLTSVAKGYKGKGKSKGHSCSSHKGGKHQCSSHKGKKHQCSSHKGEKHQCSSHKGGKNKHGKSCCSKARFMGGVQFSILSVEGEDLQWNYNGLHVAAKKKHGNAMAKFGITHNAAGDVELSELFVKYHFFDTVKKGALKLVVGKHLNPFTTHSYSHAHEYTFFVRPEAEMDTFGEGNSYMSSAALKYKVAGIPKDWKLYVYANLFGMENAEGFTPVAPVSDTNSTPVTRAISHSYNGFGAKVKGHTKGVHVMAHVGAFAGEDTSGNVINLSVSGKVKKHHYAVNFENYSNTYDNFDRTLTNYWLTYGYHGYKFNLGQFSSKEVSESLFSVSKMYGNQRIGLFYAQSDYEDDNTKLGVAVSANF